MQITVDELLRGKGSIIKGKEYLSTAAYVEPFLERMSKFTSDFRVQVKLPDQVTYTKDKEIKFEDTTFNRVWVEGILPEELNYPNHKESISLMYALDTRKPVVKLFRSGINMACLNLCIFSPSFINVQGLEPESAINFKPIQSLMEETSDICSWLKRLEETEVPYNEELINENLGLWVRNTINKSYDNGYGKVKLSASAAVDAYKNLYENKESHYYIKPGEVTNMFNIYNSWTDVISNDGTKENPQGGDICNKADKILLLKDIISL